MKLQIAETALAAFESKSGGREGWRSLDAKIPVRVSGRLTEAAHELAVPARSRGSGRLESSLPGRSRNGAIERHLGRRMLPPVQRTAWLASFSGEICAHPIKSGPLAHAPCRARGRARGYKPQPKKLGV